MSKRIKSFLITASSVLGTALLAVVVTPQWADFVQFANDKALGWGIPAVVVALLGILISEIWKAILNKITISKAVSEGMASSTSAYKDFHNELY